MSHAHVDIEGLTELDLDIALAVHELDEDLGQACLDGADAGVAEMQANHPYTDRSYRLSGEMHAEPVDENGKRHAEMVIPAPYASYVDRGTSHAKPYPFTPQGEKAAEDKLHELAEKAVAEFCAKLTE